jgi:hypothetical protein
MSQLSLNSSGGAGNRTRLHRTVENVAKATDSQEHAPFAVGKERASETLAVESRSAESGTARGPIASALFPALLAYGLTIDDLVERASWGRDDRTWVYFIQCVDGGPVKIGHARDVGFRLDKLQRCSPVKLHVIGCFRGPKIVERALHAHFAKSRLHGEWFTPTEELLSLVEKWGVL